jgi:hypothetical protein
MPHLSAFFVALLQHRNAQKSQDGVKNSYQAGTEG